MPSSADAVDRLVVAGINPAASALPVRERVAAQVGQTRDMLADLKGQGIDEAVLLSTDERFEFAGLSARPEQFRRTVTQTLAQAVSLPEEDLADQVFVLTGAEALRHLFTVAASLDGLIPGGTRAWESLRGGLATSREHGMAGPVLTSVIEAAIGVAENVRSETELSSKPVSMAAAAARIAQDIFGDLSSRALLLWGGGETGVLIADSLRKSGLTRMTIAGGSQTRREELSLVGHAVNADQIESILVKTDVLICASVDHSNLITEAMMRRVLKQRKNQPIFLIDSVVPGAIDVAAANVDGAFLYDLNDLEQVVMDSRTGARDDIALARSIIESSLRDYIGDAAVGEDVQLPPMIRQRIETVFPDSGPDPFAAGLCSFLTGHLSAIPDAEMKRDFIDRLKRMMGVSPQDGNGNES